MLFNSFDFVLFLPTVFILYWFVLNKNLKAQNTFLILASYIFYGWWDWRFLSLIFVSSLVDYCIGLGLMRQENQRKRLWLLWISIIVNVGLLGFFKYFNFFLESFVNAFTFMGHPLDIERLDIVLPVGISFYTFQTLSYTIDVYRKKLKPTKDPIAFFAYVSFFPQLVAGPIERAINLLPQMESKRTFDYTKATDGARQILWGFFKKVVIADNCAMYVNDIFANYTEYSSSTLLLGLILFSFQIYGDFSGYSDIAIGTARLLGIDLKKNFAFPYFSRDIAEFWRRWHISLSSWFKDYLYIPLGGSQKNKMITIRNIFIIFLVSGFWHGANWTFIVWGLVHALLFLPLILLGYNRRYLGGIASNQIFPRVTELLQILMTFIIVSLTWVFFRAENISIAFDYLSCIFSKSLFSLPTIKSVRLLTSILFIGIMLLFEWLQRDKEHGLEAIERVFPRPIRWIVYYGLIVLIVLYGGDQQDFFYFQF